MTVLSIDIRCTTLTECDLGTEQRFAYIEDAQSAALAVDILDGTACSTHTHTN